MIYAAIIFFILWRISPKFSCPACGSRFGAVTVFKEEYFGEMTGEHRHCFNCGHWGYTSKEDIKNHKPMNRRGR